MGVLAALKIAVLLLEPRQAFFPVRAVPWAPAAAGLAYEEIQARNADGLDLRGWFIPARDSAPGTGERPLTPRTLNPPPHGQHPSSLTRARPS